MVSKILLRYVSLGYMWPRVLGAPRVGMQDTQFGEKKSKYFFGNLWHKNMRTGVIASENDGL